jgi:hypothetical protein
MRTLTTTTKLWITIQANTEDDAQSQAKHIVDEALYAYIQSTPGNNVSISKAKVLWVKENTKE